MSQLPVKIIAHVGPAYIVTFPTSEITSAGWAIAMRRQPLAPMAVLRKFEFEDELNRAWSDLLGGASVQDIQVRDYAAVSAPTPLGEPIPMAAIRRQRPCRLS
jgi:hypothetical protein